MGLIVGIILSVFSLFFRIDCIYDFVLVSFTVCMQQTKDDFMYLKIQYWLNKKQNKAKQQKQEIWGFDLDCSQALFIYNFKF